MIADHLRVKTSRHARRTARRRVVKALRRLNSRVSEETSDPSESPLRKLTQSTDAESLKLAVKASICRSSFYEFVKKMWSTVVPEALVDNWHIRYICRVLQAAAERVFKGQPKKHDIIFNVPPGSSKSTICSIMFPAWVWTRMKSARLICCSYSEKLSLRLSGKCRDVVKSDLYKSYFPDVTIREDQDTKSEFSTPEGGARYALGSGTQVMGSHCHFILIDDPIDPEGVLSDNELNRINNWIDEQLSGRKVDKMLTVTVMIAQRLHEDDPPARMGEKKPVKWVVIPASDEFRVRPKRLKSYYKNGLMDPVRIPREALEAIKQGPRGEMIWSSQYGQRPTPPGGGMFKTDRLTILDKHVKPPKRFKHVCRFWDKAGTRGGGAYTVGVLMGMTPDNRVYVLDVIRVQVDSFTREKMIRQQARLDGKHVTVGIEQSGGEGGKESAENTVRRLVGFRVKVIRPGRNQDKEVRAEPYSVQVNAGNVYVLNKHWTKTYVSELNFFPYGRYKDQVDASSGCITVMTRTRKQVGGMRRGKVHYNKKDHFPHLKTHRIYVG